MSVYATKFEHAEVEFLSLSAGVEAAEELIVLVHCFDGVYRLEKNQLSKILSSDPMRVASLFSGAGGLDLGLEEVRPWLKCGL